MSFRMALDNNNRPFDAVGLGTSQDVTTSGVSAQSTALAATTRLVRLSATAACRIAIGTNPTATATSPLLPANVISFVRLPDAPMGTQLKIAAIQEASGGKLNIVECN